MERGNYASSKEVTDNLAKLEGAKSQDEDRVGVIVWAKKGWSLVPTALQEVRFPQGMLSTKCIRYALHEVHEVRSPQETLSTRSDLHEVHEVRSPGGTLFTRLTLHEDRSPRGSVPTRFHSLRVLFSTRLLSKNCDSL